MNRRNIIEELHQNKINEEEAEEVVSETLNSTEGANVKALLGFNDAEWTAHAQGATFSEIAFWRYYGWPKNCVLCGRVIRVEDFGWFVVDVEGAAKLKHIVCPRLN